MAIRSPRTFFSVFLAVGLAVLALWQLSAASADHNDDADSEGYGYGRPSRVTICHKPGTHAEKTLSLPEPAIAGHLGHGDTMGECAGAAVEDEDDEVDDEDVREGDERDDEDAHENDHHAATNDRGQGHHDADDHGDQNRHDNGDGLQSGFPAASASNPMNDDDDDDQDKRPGPRGNGRDLQNSLPTATNNNDDDGDEGDERPGNGRDNGRGRGAGAADLASGRQNGHRGR